MFLDMTTEAWIKVLAVIVAAYPVGLLVNLLVGRLFKLRERVGLSLLSKFTARALRRAIALLAAGLFIYSFYPALDISPKVDKYLFFGIHTLTLAGVLLLAAALWESVCDHLAERKGKDERSNVVLVTLTRKLGRGVIVSSGLLLALASYGVNVMGVLTGLGLSGLIIALAAKDSVENIFGSLTILLDMPFSLGEWIKVGNIEGVVEEINLRSTRLRTFEDSVITLPNANIIKAAV